MGKYAKPILEYLNIASVALKAKKKLSAKRIWRVLERDNFMCQICGAAEYLTLDHRIPKQVSRDLCAQSGSVDFSAYGGEMGYLPMEDYFSDIRNLWILCVSCHAWKNWVVDAPHTKPRNEGYIRKYTSHTSKLFK